MTQQKTNWYASVKRWLWVTTKGSHFSPCSFWSCYVVIISQAGWKGVKQVEEDICLLGLLQDEENLFSTWKSQQTLKKKKVLQQDNRGASPHHKMLLIQVACSAKVCTIGKLRCNPRVPQALALPHTTVHYPHALFLSDVWQLKIRLLLYYNAHIGTSPKHTSIQTLTYIRKITEHWGLYINRNNGQI